MELFLKCHSYTLNMTAIDFHAPPEPYRQTTPLSVLQQSFVDLRLCLCSNYYDFAQRLISIVGRHVPPFQHGYLPGLRMGR